VAGIKSFLLAIAALALVVSTTGGQTAPIYSTPVLVTELNSPDHEFPNSISFDGLRMVINSNRGQAGMDLYFSSRATVASPWSAPSATIFSNINNTAEDIFNGIISPNGLELYYSAQNTNATPQTHLMRATRADASQPFAATQEMLGLQTNSGIHRFSYMSSDGLRLYYWNAAGEKFVISRPSTGSAFGPPSSASFVNLSPYTATENPWLTADELGMYLNNGDSMWWTSRPNTASPFAAPVPVSSINDSGSASGPVLYGSTLFFNRGTDIYQASRVPEPATAALICMLIPLLLRRSDPH
jgi:hypothetical protein